MVSVGAADTLSLTNGDQLSGQVQLGPKGRITLSHDILGTISLDSNQVQSGDVTVKLSDGSSVSGALIGFDGGQWLIKPADSAVLRLDVTSEGLGLATPPEPEAAATGASADQTRSIDVMKEASKAAEARIGSARKVIEAAEAQLKKPWTGSFSLGGSMSRGTADSSNVLINVGLTRAIDDSATKIKAFYILNTDGNETTQNWFQASLDHSWDIPNTDGKWGVFGLAVFDYQTQASWEQRANANIGVQYLLIDATRAPGTDWFQKFRLRGRVGPGVRKEFAGDYTDLALEVLLGGTWDVAFLKGVTFKGNAQVYPDLSDIGEFRVTANTSFMVAIESMPGVSVGIDLKFQYQSQVDPGAEDYLLVISGQMKYDF
jgi:putative salt-induced outer membrane protein YdiY